jgi:hypothetical protein
MASVTRPFDQQEVNPTMKSIAIPTTAASLFVLFGDKVFNEGIITKAKLWIGNLTIKRDFRPNRSTVNVLTSTIRSYRTD